MSNSVLLLVVSSSIVLYPPCQGLIKMMVLMLIVMIKDHAEEKNVALNSPSYYDG